MSTDEAPAKPKGPEKVRSTLGRVIRDAFDEDYLREFAQSIKSMSMGAWGYGVCPECGSQKKVLAQFPDIKGQIAAWTELMEQAEGRPGTDAGGLEGTTIVVERPPRA